LALGGEELDLTGLETLDDLLQRLRSRGGVWAEVFGSEQRVMVALNQELAALDSPLKEGDEVAFFPPVTGG
jgi:molybdopterin synthase sulfur carrier subunit